MMIGIKFVSRARFNRSHSSKPSISGSIRSSRIKSGIRLGDHRESLLSREYLDRFETTSLHKIGQDIVGVALIVDDQNGARHGEKLEETTEV